MATNTFDLIGLEPESLGWVPPEKRDADTQDAHAAIVASMPEFKIVGTQAAPPDKVLLFDFEKQANGGDYFPCLYQETGSCVGQGMQRVIHLLMCVEKFRVGDAQEVVMPFLPYHYGRGRLRSGIRGRGDGSTGTGQAEAAKSDGFLPYNAKGVPLPVKKSGGLTWGAAVEMQWSDGARIGDQYLIEGRTNLVKTFTIARSTADLRMGLANGYPATCASNWGGLMQCPVSEGVLLNRRAGTWMHQMSVLGYRDHPKLGMLYWVQNSWGPDAHGVCPTGAPPGGFWVREKDMADIVSQGETIMFSQFDGFPAQPDIFLLI